MTAAGELLNHVVPTLVRIARRPGALLLTAAGVNLGLFAVLGLVLGLTGDAWTAWLPLAVAAVLAVPVLALTVRRHRLQRQTADLGPGRTVPGRTGDVTVVRAGAAPGPAQREAEVLSAAMAESTLRTARFLPRVEAAQRAALVAAGGPVHAPYLRDDLRVTVAALLGTLAAVPISVLGWVVTGVLLLTR